MGITMLDSFECIRKCGDFIIFSVGYYVDILYWDM